MRAAAIVPGTGEDRHKAREETMPRSRAADDFAAIRTRLEELRRERAEAMHGTSQEPADRRPVSRGLIDEQALLRRIRERDRFSR